MGLSWQQGPLGRDPNGTFIAATPMPERVLYMEPLRRRMSVELGGSTIARSDEAVILFEPGRYPVAYFPIADIDQSVLQASDHESMHPDLGDDEMVRRRRRRRRDQRNAAPGSTSIRLHRRRQCATRSRSRGGRWTPSTRRTSASSATPPTLTTVSTSDAAPAISSSGTAIRSSRTRRPRLCSTSRASHRAGTSRAPTSSSTPSSRSKGRPSAHTRAWRPTTTSATPETPLGPIALPSTRWRAIAGLVSF